MAALVPVTRKFCCTYCNKGFGRVEHLKRHVLIHTKEKSFTCRSCTKTFFRRDALQRHQVIHSSLPNLLQRGARACTHCASAKARCSGDEQCSRCQNQNLDCVYPDMGETASASRRHSRHNSNLDTSTHFVHVDTGMFEGDELVVESTMPSNPGIYEPDLYVHNVLSTANWLDAMETFDFEACSVPNLPAIFPTHNSTPTNSALWSSFSSTSARHTPGHLISLGDVGVAQTVDSTLLPQETDSLTESTVCDEEVVTEIGQFYVGCESARLPKSKRRKLSALQPFQHQQVITAFSLANNIVFSAAFSPNFTVGLATYEEIRALYNKLCLGPQILWPAFESAELPPHATFEHLVNLYLTNLGGVLPFIQRADISLSPVRALLSLAMSAIGSSYLPEGSVTRCFHISIQEFVRRALIHQKERNDSGTVEEALAQVRLLHALSSAYSGDDRLNKLATDEDHALRQVYYVARRKVIETGFGTWEHGDASIEDRWKMWRNRESAIRLAYAAWLVDCMWKYHFDAHRSFWTPDRILPLPSGENVWEANTAQEWNDMRSNISAPTKSLSEASADLYIDKHLPDEASEFALIILVHSLFHRSWEVENYFSNPLSSWEPTAKRQTSTDLLPRMPIWLPSVRTFSKWQSSACDALDVLHWQANSKIGQASSFEHPTVLHLHLARIVLLAPFTHIRNLVNAYVTGSTVQISDQEIIQRWVFQHQYKARLAIVHAGTVLWHVRRFSIDAYYEPPAVELATLTLWAFSTFVGKHDAAKPTSCPPTRQQSPQPAASDISDDAMCSIILLDRPTDDELVQQFIKHGLTMRAHLTGVGDLYGINSPQRILLQGCRLLSTLKCWGIATSLLQRLHKLRNIVL